MSIPCTSFSGRHGNVDRTPNIGRLNHVNAAPKLICRRTSITPGDRAPRHRVNCSCLMAFSVSKTSRTGNARLFHSPSTMFCLSSPVHNVLNFTHSNCLGAFDRHVRGNRGTAVNVDNSGGSAHLLVGKRMMRRVGARGLCCGTKGSSVGCIHALIFPLRGTKGFSDGVAGLGICGGWSAGSVG